MFQFAFGASTGLYHAVAHRPPLPHERAALAQKTQAARMCGGDDAAARPPGRKDFLQPQTGHEGVEVNDVGTNFAEPAVEVFCAAHDRIALCLVAGGEFRHRVPEDEGAIEFVRPRIATPGSGAATSTSWPQALS